MGLYIGTLFELGDLDEPDQLSISGMSQEIDAYYNSLDAGIHLEKPKPKISRAFNEIFTQLEHRGTDRWTEIGVILNRISPDDQRELENLIEQLRIGVRRNWRKDGHENMLVLQPSKSSNTALAYVMYCDENSDRRYEFYDAASREALAPPHVEQSLVIGKNVDNPDPGYDFIALVNTGDDRETYDA